MKFEEFQRILNFSKDRNKEIESQKELTKMFEELNIESFGDEK